VDYIVAHHGCSRRRACRLVRQHRSTQYYASVKDRHDDPRARMREIARGRVRYGYRRIPCCRSAKVGVTIVPLRIEVEKPIRGLEPTRDWSSRARRRRSICSACYQSRRRVCEL
jgi:hypothetical protein